MPQILKTLGKEMMLTKIQCDDTEEALVVMIPRSDHNLPKCKEAKDKEMQGWIENKSYTEVDDVGQTRIPSMWIMTEKNVDGIKGVKALLDA